MIESQVQRCNQLITALKSCHKVHFEFKCIQGTLPTDATQLRTEIFQKCRHTVFFCNNHSWQDVKSYSAVDKETFVTLLRLRQPAQEYNTIVLILDPTLLDTDPPSQLQCLKEFEDVALFHKKGQHKSESVYLFCCRRFTQQALATSIYRQLQKEWDSPGRISFLQYSRTELTDVLIV